MKGFFENNNRDSIELSSERKKTMKRSGCGTSCMLCTTCKNPKMKLTGQGIKKIMLVSDFPSKMEDETNKKFSGESGNIILSSFGQTQEEFDNNFYMTYAVRCHTPETRQPTKKEIDACSNLLREDILSRKPKVIILLGDVALESFLKNRWKKDIGTIHKWRGLQIYDREYDCWVVATYSPFEIIKQKAYDILQSIFKKDIKQAIQLCEKPLPVFEDEKQFIQMIENESLALKMLDRVKQKEKLIAFDFETTGIRPYSKGHKIISFSIAYSETSCFSCLATSQTIEKLKGILEYGGIKKIASNMKYEHLWAKEILGVEVQGWIWDTMLASHILDNRTGISSLKFQTYIRFGIIDYASVVDKYLNSDGKEFNRIEEAPVKDLLLYNGLDSLFEFRLAKIQMEEMNEAK